VRIGIAQLVGWLPARRGTGRLDAADELGRQLVEKARRRRGLVLTEDAAARGAREDELLARPRDAHVADSSFLLDLFLVFHGPCVREESFFHARHDHDGKLEALGRVHRHEPDAGVSRPLALVGFREQ
jgi:hypothetical protein